MSQQPSNLLAERGGQQTSKFINDDELQKLCMARFHGWINGAGGSPLGLTEPAKGVYAHDALLNSVASDTALQLEYKWDRYAVRNLAGEVISKDRGRDKNLGYLLKHGYDWLVYGYVNYGVVYFFEAQCARKYAFTRWALLNFGATHCANRNRDNTSAWNLLIPVEAMYRQLAEFGLAFRIKVPQGLFDPNREYLEDERGAQLRQLAAMALERVFECPLKNRWLPSASAHWAGIDEHMHARNATRPKYIPDEVTKSELGSFDWCELAIAQGLMKP